MSIGDLCAHFKIPQADREAFAKRLGRLRRTIDASLYRETERGAPRDARYLYNAADARIVEAARKRPPK